MCNNCVTRGVFFLRLRSLVSLISELTDFLLSKTKLEKTADILQFPREMASEERAKKFHTDEATLPKITLCI